MRITITFFLLYACICLNAQSRMIADKVVGLVGDNAILYSDVEIQRQQFLAQAEGVEDPNLACEIFDQLLLEKLFLKQAQIDSVTVGQDEVDSELDRRIRYFVSMFGTQERLEEYYGKSILELKSEFEEDIYKQLLADRMKATIFQGLTITPAEVKQFFAEIPEDSLPFFNAEVEVAQLVIYPKVSKPQRDYAREKVMQMREEILNGSDFCVKALIYSDDPGTKEECGNLGFIRRGEMVPEFEAAAFRLDVNELSDVVETDFGFHLLQCLEKQGDRVMVRHILVAPKITSVEMQQARKLIDSIGTLLDAGTISFKKAVQEFSEDETSQLNQGLLVNPNSGTSVFDISEMDTDLGLIVSEMSVGERSSVIPFSSETGKSGNRIINLVSETEPHQANLKEDYSKIQGAAKQAKQQQLLEDWVSEKSTQTYIFVDPTFSSCPLMQKWFAE